MKEHSGQAKLDEIDKKILQVMQKDGRITNLQLSNEIGLSPAPTLERVRKLERSNVIESYHARLNARKMGYGLKVIIQVSLIRQIDNAMQKFTRKVIEIPEVIECLQVTGEYDYYLKALVKDIEALDKLVNQKLSTIEEIRQMHSSVILSTVKDSWSIPVQ